MGDAFTLILLDRSWNTTPSEIPISIKLRETHLIILKPNASRIMSHWGLMNKLYAAGAVVKEDIGVFRWSDGKLLTTRPGKIWVSYQARGIRPRYVLRKTCALG